MSRLPRVVILLVLVAGLAQLPAAAGETADVSLYRIPFASGTVDPALDWEARAPRDRDLVLVQWREFGRRGIVDDLAGTGATLVQPLAPVSYLVWADAAQTAALRRVDGVRFAGVLPAHARIAPSVTAGTTRLRVTLVGADGLAGLDLATWDRAFTGIAGAVVEIDGGAARAAELAAVPRVYSVADAGGAPQLRDEKTVQAVAHGTDAPLTPGYDAFLEAIGADGSGVVIAEVDGGVDFNHPELMGQVVGCVDYVVTAGGGQCNVRNHDDAIGHGTHVLGHVLGTGATGLGDSDGFAYGQGVAPGAKAFVQNAINAATLVGPDPFADGFRPVYQDAQEAGAVVSQNSWGPAPDPQGYDQDTREFDSIVRDANSDEAGDQPLGLVFSIMNGGGGESSQGSPDEGKNIIGVGGTGARDARTGAGPSLDDLCTCTAHGPALDGRLLPTIVAPAENVMSTRAAQGTLCGLFPDAEDTPSPLHAPCTGTSFASPHVTGAYAVFTDWYRQHHAGDDPSPALVKAAFVNSADDMVGGEDADGRVMGPIPNPQQGWGRLNLGNLVDAWTAGAVHVDESVVFTATGATHAVTVEPIDPAQPMKATLTWTDALGPGTGGEVPAWVNDLDLTVAAPDGQTYLGNFFADGMSAAGGAPDRRNNVENVYLAQPPAGPHTVTVTAANLIGDGLPNRTGATDQDFALVVTNARVVPVAP